MITLLIVLPVFGYYCYKLAFPNTEDSNEWKSTRVYDETDVKLYWALRDKRRSLLNKLEYLDKQLGTLTELEQLKNRDNAADVKVKIAKIEKQLAKLATGD